MKILAVSDIVIDWIYSPKIRLRLSDIDLVIGCGDLPQNYLEFILNTLDIPVYYVQGNHSKVPAQGSIQINKSRRFVDLHCSSMRINGLTFAGVEGSLRYKDGVFQYSQFEMWLNVFQLVPTFLLNRISSGRLLNVFISHAPPWGIQDQSDLAHQGIKAFRWLLDRFHPDYHLHGHIHVYRPDMITDTIFGNTKEVNVYGYRKIDI